MGKMWILFSDKWLCDVSLSRWPLPFNTAFSDSNRKVADLISEDKEWDVPLLRQIFIGDVIKMILHITVPEEEISDS